MKRYSRNLLIVFFVTGIALIPVLNWLNVEGKFPLHDEEAPFNYIVGISLYNGFALVGLIVLTKFFVGGSEFIKRLAGFIGIFMVAVVVRVMLIDQSTEPVTVAGIVLWETARAICVAFAVGYLAHALMSRYLPSTLLRTRAITPVLNEGKKVDAHRRRHIKRARWIFEMGSRQYLDSTKLHLRTRVAPSFDWKSWGEATLWSALGLIALSVYAEAYPRVEERIDIFFTAIISAHLLSLVPLLVLPVYPVETVGPVIPAGRGEFDLARGYRVQSQRWVKVAFFPIIAVGLLVRSMPMDTAVQLTQALLITVPTTAITCMVYLEIFRNRTAAEIHKAIPIREEVDKGLYDDEPWRETSLMEGVEVLKSDIYLE